MKDSVENQVDEPKDNRVRNYCCEVYPDSAPEHWIALLNELHIPCLISPLHDRDFNPGTGLLKKPHYHILMCFEGKKSYSQVKEYVQSFGGVIPPYKEAVVQSIRGYARYLCHLDNPEKAQYDISGIKALGGADYETYTTLPTDVSREIKLMQKYIRKMGIKSFSVFLDICADSFPDWHYMIVNRCTNIVKEYLKSVNYDYKECGR